MYKNPSNVIKRLVKSHIRMWKTQFPECLFPQNENHPWEIHAEISLKNGKYYKLKFMYLGIVAVCVHLLCTKHTGNYVYMAYN